MAASSFCHKTFCFSVEGVDGDEADGVCANAVVISTRKQARCFKKALSGSARSRSKIVNHRGCGGANAILVKPDVGNSRKTAIGAGDEVWGPSGHVFPIIQQRTVSAAGSPHPSIFASRSCFTAVSELTGE